MANLDEAMSFDCIPNIVADTESTQFSSIFDEFYRCRSLYNQRRALKSNKISNIKPLYYKQMTNGDLAAKHEVYKLRCIANPLKSYGSCKHVGQIIIDRDILYLNEHLSFLAQNKKSHGQVVRKPHCFYQKRLLPNCTTRINSLANPKLIHVKYNWYDYTHLLSVRQATNLRKIVARPALEYTSIKNAITYIQEERRLQREMRKEANRRCKKTKRKLLKKETKQMFKVVIGLYEVIKNFLMNDHFVMESSELSGLGRLLESRIGQFCSLDSPLSSHEQQLIRTAAQNLAIWMDKFALNCGFKRTRVEKKMQRMNDVCMPNDGKELVLPVDDYISYRSSSISEDYTDTEDFANIDKYEDDVIK